MAQAARKLQAEIDRTLKKVQEGQEIFEDIWQKVLSPSWCNDASHFMLEWWLSNIQRGYAKLLHEACALVAACRNNFIRPVQS